MDKLHSIERLINSLSKLPSVGNKSAERMAYSLLEWNEEDIKEFASSLEEIKAKVHKCPICGTYTEEKICPFCSSELRDKSKIMVVANSKDVFTIEKSEIFNGLYHVLGGVISQRNGISIEDLSIEQLINRIKEGNIKEVVIATNPDIDGETTALYIARKLEKYDVNVTRLGYGLQMGGQLEYVDSITLQRALEGRKKI